MKISIIIPAYNIEKYLPKCVKSVIHQDYNDLEIVIVDDGSKDNTGQMADQLRERYNNYLIKVIHQENKGLGGARNTGIKNSKGEYLLFLDGDDLLMPNALKKLDYILNSNNIDVLCFGFKSINPKDVQTYIYKSNYNNSNNMKIEPHCVSKQEYLLSCGITACNKIYKRALFQNSDLYFPEKLIYEDLATTPKVIMYAEIIARIDDILYLYIQRAGSIISTPKEDRIFEVFAGFDSVLDAFNSSNLFAEFREELEWDAILHCYYYTLLRTFCLGFPQKKYIKKVKQYIEERFPDYTSNKYIEDVYSSRDIRDCVKQKYFTVAIRNYWKRYIKIGLRKLIHQESSERGN